MHHRLRELEFAEVFGPTAPDPQNLNQRRPLPHIALGSRSTLQRPDLTIPLHRSDSRPLPGLRGHDGHDTATTREAGSPDGLDSCSILVGSGSRELLIFPEVSRISDSWDAIGASSVSFIAQRPRGTWLTGRLTVMSAEETELRIAVDHLANERTYEALGEELHRLIDRDPRFPSDQVYAIKWRYKDRDRLIEKVREHQANGVQIDESNYRDHIHDILGMRVVTLRMSEKAEVDGFVEQLINEGTLKLHRRKAMATFSDTAGATGQDSDLEMTDPQYTGYSSIQYVLSLNENEAKKVGVAGPIELQIRTIFEEAWGEVDHKYRYERSRAGESMPPHVDAGFRDLSHYLLSVARHAEHLCEDIDRASGKPPTQAETERQAEAQERALRANAGKGQETGAEQDDDRSLDEVIGEIRAGINRKPNAVASLVESRFGFRPSDTTLRYVVNRLEDHSWETDEFFDYLSDDLVSRYQAIFKDVLGYEAFSPDNTRDFDLIPLVNFGIFSSYRSQEEAEAGLRATLEDRPRR